MRNALLECFRKVAVQPYIDPRRSEIKPRTLPVFLLVGTLLVHLLPGSQPATQDLARADLAVAAPLFRPLSDAPWSANVRVNDDAGAAYQDYPSIAVDASGNAYSVWTDGRNGNRDIYFSYRPVGDSWGVNLRVNDDAGTAWLGWPSVAADASGNGYAVWDDQRSGNPDIYFSYRPAGGDWGANVRVNDDGMGYRQDNPCIAVDANGNAYSVWTDERNGYQSWDIYFSYRPAGGTWGANVRVNDDTGAAWQGYASIAVDGSGNAYAVWDDWRNGNRDIYFSYRPAGGDWGANVRVNDDAGTSDQMFASIAVDTAGNAYAVWNDQRNGHYDIYFSYRPAGGSWAAKVMVNDSAGTDDEVFPSIAVDASGNAYAVWEDNRNINHDIYFSYRAADGTWGPNVRVKGDAGALSQYRPSIAVDAGGNAYAAWADGRNGHDDIYFSYRPAGRPLLQLPFDPAAQTGVCHNSQSGLNCISSYFDHRYPLYDAEGPSNTNTVVVYYGNVITSTTTACRPQQITDEGKVCYSGHPAYDFYLPRGRVVRAAADGYATGTWSDSCGGIVRIDHGNGYSTEYWHLLDDEYRLTTPVTVTAGTRVGSVGQPPSLSCGRGYHLHFEVRRSDVVVDPYGWTADYEDPWPLNGGLSSTCLWSFGCPTSGLCTPANGGTVSSSDGNILVSAVPGACSDITSLHLTLTPDPVAEPSAIPAWHSFAISARDTGGNPVTSFSEPLTIEVNYSGADTAYLQESTLSLYSWDDSTSAWLPISTLLDLVNNRATSNVTHLSLFSLMGQPQYPAPSVATVSPSSGYNHLDTEITISGTNFISTPSMRLGPNELAVAFVDSTTLSAVVPSSLDPGTYDLTVTNPDAQEASADSAFTVEEPLKVYLPLTVKNY